MRVPLPRVVSAPGLLCGFKPILIRTTRTLLRITRTTYSPVGLWFVADLECNTIRSPRFSTRHRKSTMP